MTAEPRCWGGGGGGVSHPLQLTTRLVIKSITTSPTLAGEHMLFILQVSILSEQRKFLPKYLPVVNRAPLVMAPGPMAVSVPPPVAHPTINPGTAAQSVLLDKTRPHILAPQTPTAPQPYNADPPSIEDSRSDNKETNKASEPLNRGTSNPQLSLDPGTTNHIPRALLALLPNNAPGLKEQSTSTPTLPASASKSPSRITQSSTRRADSMT